MASAEEALGVGAQEAAGKTKDTREWDTQSGY